MAGRSAIGLDIGTSGVRAAELSFGKGGVTLEKFGQVALPEGAVRDGEVVDSDAVADAIKQLWAHTKFGSKKVVIGVANQKVIVRQVDLPWMPADELKKSLAFQVQDFVPMPVDQAVLDFHPLEELGTEGGNRLLRGLLVAASRDMVNASLEAVQKAGLSPVMVDLTSFAVIRSLADADHLGLGAQVEALVDVGARVTNIVVHQGGIPRFVRILLMGGQDVTDAVAERMGVPQEQAEALKQQLGSDSSAHGADVQAAGRVIEAVAASFVDEVRGSLDYYLASSGSAPDLAPRPHRRRRAARRPGPAAPGHHAGAGRGRHPDAQPAGRPHRPVARADRLRRAAGRRAGRPGPGSRIMTTSDHGDHHHAGRPAAGQPAAAGDRRGAPAPQAAGRPRRRRRRRRCWSSGRSSSRPTARSPTRRTTSTPPRRGAPRCRPRRTSTPTCRPSTPRSTRSEAQLSLAMGKEIRWSYFLNDLSLDHAGQGLARPR